MKSASAPSRALPTRGRGWVSGAATTEQGDDAYLVVMNPFDADAVFDVALFAAGRAPIRDSELTDVTLRPRRSVSIRLNEYAQGEDALGVSIEVATGRLAASPLVVSDGRGIGSVFASAIPADRHLLLDLVEGCRPVDAGRTVPTVAAGGGPRAAGRSARCSPPPFGPRSRRSPPAGLTDSAQEPGVRATFR